MTIDERLDRLTERHEALTQTVEIIASMQKENEAQIHRVGERIDSLAGIVRDLVEIVRSHQDRLDSLEG